MSQDLSRRVDSVWRAEAGRLIAGLTRLVRDVSIAEEVAQDALVAALEQWPRSGVPDNPAAWLMRAAKNKAIDRLRRNVVVDDKHQQLAHDTDDALHTVDDRLDEVVRDDLLKLIFIACHPSLSQDSQVALTLRLLGGLSTDEIARAFLVPEPTIAQRIVRAKRALSEAKAPFELPPADELTERLTSVLGVLYLIFNEGYAATSGDDWVRPALCDEALRLARVLAEAPLAEGEVHGLVALMELQASRTAARIAADGAPIRLLEQDRRKWDRSRIERGLTALARAKALGRRGNYLLQAELAACHARAGSPEETDWRRIVALYDELAASTPSPIVELNRAVAVSMADGPAAALPLVEALADEPQLQGYHLLAAVRAELLLKLGRQEEAKQEFRRAATLTRNEREKQLLLERAASC